MRVNERVQVRPKEALAPYLGTVVAVGDGTVDVRADDGSVRTHPVAQCEAIGAAECIGVDWAAAYPTSEAPSGAHGEYGGLVDDPPVVVPVVPAKKARKPRKAAK